MPIVVDIADKDGIKLYLNDTVVDAFGAEWVLSVDNNKFYFRLIGTNGKGMLNRLPLIDAHKMKLKWYKTL